MTSSMSVTVDAKTAEAALIAEPRNKLEARRRSDLGLWLTSGGDERIWLDPISRRNRYGVPASPTPDEIWLSASTASAISSRGYVAASEIVARLSGEQSPALNLGVWFDDLRARLVAAMGVPGSEAILAASGTETELITLTLAKALMQRPIANIVVAPNETGNGVVQAAVGNHFADSSVFRLDMQKGSRLSGWESEPFTTTTIDIRNDQGELRDLTSIDRESISVVEEAIRRGRDVLLHVLDASKTGRQAPSRSAAREIAKQFGNRVLVVIDACQLRCSFDEIKDDLEQGFIVMVTGSKFAGGPPFSGAVLVPPGRLEQLRHLRAPVGLSAYSAKFDWPSCLRRAVDGEEFGAINVGMGLRWEAALAEIEAYVAIPSHIRKEIASVFARTVCEFVGACPNLSLLDEISTDGERTPSIFPIIVGGGEAGRTRLIYEALRTPQVGSNCSQAVAALSRVCHVGQPVGIAQRSALRISSSMPLINDVAARLKGAKNFNSAFLPLRESLDTVIRKCGWLSENMPE
jgi:hypothetical protein